jgi:hypothetical protein
LIKDPAISQSSGSFGRAIHHGHLVLGRVALVCGDIEKAKEHLIEAGRTNGSPDLNSFGPNMTLAKELLVAGEKDAVLQYFELCKAFWKLGADRLEIWSERVQNDEIPIFGANLRY